MKSIAALSVLAIGALAQQSTLVPSGISTGCASFLTQLNSDSGIASCTSKITTALASTGDAALTGLCASSVDSACSQSAIRTQLTNFYGACRAELSGSPNAQVVKVYDLLYAVVPFRQAVCAKDASTGAQCITSDKVSGVSASSLVSSGLADLQAFASNNVPFLGLSASTPASSLCNACTKAILTPYSTFMTAVPYAPGLANSQLLSGESALYNGVLKSCGSTFMDTTGVAAAGSLGSSNSAARSVAGSAGLLVAGIAAVLAL